MSRRSTRSARLSSDDGAAAVEFALLIPLFVMICFGTISVGILFSDKLALSQGVREAARYGATLPYTAGGETAFLTTVRDAAGDADFGQLDPGDPAYCVALKVTSGTFHMKATDTSAQPGGCPGGPAAADLPSTAHVLVLGQEPATFDIIVNRWTVTLTSTSVARFEGTA